MANEPRIANSLVRLRKDVKSAVAQLLAAFPNVEEAAKVCRVGSSTLSAYANPNHGSHVPVDIVLELEGVLGKPIVTRHMANRLGYELYQLPRGQNTDPLARRINRIVKKGSRAFATAAGALDDGTVTPEEAEQLLDDVERAIAAFVELSCGLEGVVNSRKPYKLISA